jgi:hypothetical protein
MGGGGMQARDLATVEIQMQVGTFHEVAVDVLLHAGLQGGAIARTERTGDTGCSGHEQHDKSQALEKAQK